MKKIIILCCAVALAGCASITIGDMTYTRIGDQQITGLYVERTDSQGNRTVIKVKKQISTAESLEKALDIIELVR